MQKTNGKWIVLGFVALMGITFIGLWKNREVRLPGIKNKELIQDFHLVSKAARNKDHPTQAPNAQDVFVSFVKLSQANEKVVFPLALDLSTAPDPVYREAAIEGFARLISAEAFERLKLLANTDPDENVKKRALRAMSYRRGPEHEQFLKEYIAKSSPFPSNEFTQIAYLSLLRITPRDSSEYPEILKKASNIILKGSPYYEEFLVIQNNQ